MKKTLFKEILNVGVDKNMGKNHETCMHITKEWETLPRCTLNSPGSFKNTHV